VIGSVERRRPIPLGAVLAGFLIDEVGLIPTIVGMGAVYFAVTLDMFLNPALRWMDVRS
jgi:hypothetical protein